MKKRGRKDKNVEREIGEIERNLKKKFPFPQPERIRWQKGKKKFSKTAKNTSELTERVERKVGLEGGKKQERVIAEDESFLSAWPVEEEKREPKEIILLEELALREQLSSLNPKDRQIARLVSEGKSLGRIGQVIRRHQCTVKRKILKMIKNLQEEMQKPPGNSCKFTKFLFVLWIKRDCKQDYMVKGKVREKYLDWLECQDDEKWRDFVKEYNRYVPVSERISEKKCQ